MSTATPAPVPESVANEAVEEAGGGQELETGKKRGKSAAGNAARAVSSKWASLFAVVMALAWTTPTFGLFVTSFREQKDIQSTGWWNAWRTGFTMDNYKQVLQGAEGQPPLTDFFVNSFVIVIPAVLLPLLLASLAAYAFAWMKFPGRDWLLIGVIMMLAVPLQVAFIPLARMFGALGIYGSVFGVILFHVAFGLPFAIFLLRNFFVQIPGELLESARIDGAGEWRIFFTIVLPLGLPAIASLSIFQFLWTWNDMLVALIFTNSDSQPLTVAIQSQLRQFGSNIDVLSSGAFLSMLVPLFVFFAFQRYFVQALLAGSQK